jgi:hypothetical protein
VSGSNSTKATIKDSEIQALLDSPVKDEEFLEPQVQLMKLLQAQPPALRRPVFNHVHAVDGRASDTSGFHPGEYGFHEIGMAEDTDSFVMQANVKKLALSMKAGYAFVGKNQVTLEYLKRRLSEMEVAQGFTFRSLVSEVMANLIRYNNCYIVKARDIAASSGKVRVLGRRKIKPVAGYFAVSPETMSQRVDSSNNVQHYKHTMSDGRYRIFKAEDVIHLHVYKKTHFLVGTPSWTPVLEDVRALRRIEEHIENLVYQHIYPLFQYKVGTEKSPMRRFQDGLTEVDIIKSKIRNMPTDGMLVTPERHEIKAIGSESRAIRAEPYLEHFKKRVITGTGLSAIDFGDGNTANRSTASTMSKLAIDNVKFYQETFADAFNFEITRELLLEAQFSFNPLDHENMVELRFNEVDLEAHIKKQNHFGLLWQMNILTETEARREMGFGAMKESERDQRYVNLVGEAEVNPAAQNKQQPENQHGVNSGPEARKSERMSDSIMRQVYDELLAEIRMIRSGNSISLGYVRRLFDIASNRVVRNFSLELDSSLRRGMVGMPVNKETWSLISTYRDELSVKIELDVSRLFTDSADRVTSQLLEGSFGSEIVDSLSYRIDMIERTLHHSAYISGKLALYKSNNIENIKVIATKGGSDYADWNGMVIKVGDVNLNQLPPFHPNCKCDIIPEVAYE